MQRRDKRLRPALAPLTPVLPQPVVGLTREELIAQNNYATYLLKQERRRHAGVEKQFLKVLDDLQNMLNDVRVAYVESVAAKMVPTRGETR
jgi:hypothetical protein